MRYQAWRVAIFSFFFTFYLFGCASAPPIVQTQIVKVPVATPCISESAARWLYGFQWADTNEAIQQAENHEARVNLMIAGRIARDGWIEQALSQIKICASLSASQTDNLEH